MKTDRISMGQRVRIPSGMGFRSVTYVSELSNILSRGVSM